MSTDYAYSAIHDFIAANWMTTPIVFENENADLPDAPASFVLAEVSGNIYSQQSIGAGSPERNLWREQGLLWLHIMTPAGGGSLLARQYARILANLFRGRELAAGALVFEDISIGLGETADMDGNYWRMTVTVDWRMDHTT